jgi:hypothetical protein
LIECAQHYALPPKVSKELSKRQQHQPEPIKQLSWKAQTRLYRRFWALMQRGLLRQKAVVAVARELSGFIWALMRQVPLPGDPPLVAQSSGQKAWGTTVPQSPSS